ncbi:MAG: beta-galactosidase [Chthoniobacter sp.]|nr:beta-galactosidase [Chthoniobacter sp.]
MFKQLISTLTLLVIATTTHAQQQNSSQSKYNFNSGWLVKMVDDSGAEAVTFVDTDWKKVTLPHAWNEDSAFKVHVHDLPTGIAWYRKHFKLPANAKGRKVFLEFEGIRQGGEFFLNGESIGLSENGVMAFGFDITDKVKPAPEENVIAARIDNAWSYKERETRSSFQWNDKNFYANYGGINKNVFLHVTDKLHQTLPLYSNLGTTGVYVYAQDFDIKGKSAKVTAEAQVKNEYAEPKAFSYEVAITDPQGKTVKTFGGSEQTIAPGEIEVISADAKVEGLNFWSWGYGYLYDVATTLKVGGKPVDTVVTRTGFRKLEFGHGMVKLNDRTIQFKGYAQRSTNEWPAIGLSVPPWMSDFSNALMVESNGNLVRWMHVTPWKQDVESCDRVGLMQAMPAGDSEKDVDGRRWELRVQLMRDATIYNRNNPSIVMYEGGNKGISEAHMAELKAVRDQYDPHGGRAAGCREMLDSKIAEYGGEMLYINKSARIPFWATEYSRDEGLRKYWDDWTPPYHKDGDGPEVKPGESGAPYNRNQDSFAREDVVRWFDYWQERPGTGERVNAGGVNIIFADSNTHSRGVENYRRSGEVDAMRIPKEGFFAHQVMWDGWVNTEHQHIHIIGHWNYEANVKKPVYVVSSADKVELFINNQSKGFGDQSSRFLYTWKELPFQPGEIKAVGYDAAGKKLCEDAKRTAGNPAAIKLTPRTGPNGLKADGADMALVDVEVMDAQGNRCPTALNLIKFDLQGPAEWRGGIAQGPDNYILSKELPVECGINRVILRSQPKAGKIILNASADGLKAARIELVSSPFSATDGLANTSPDAGLTARLDRGPTPAGDSVVPTRTPIRIVSATAGASAEQAGQAFDDNEETAWKNDGQRATGWIQFELERPANVNEVVLKLGGWRNKSYPLRITVEGKEAYSGTTPKTLGYVTLPLKPTQGKTVRIELVGAIDDKDGFGMVEVTGKKLDDAAASTGGAKGTLEILEAEVYEPLATTAR